MRNALTVLAGSAFLMGFLAGGASAGPAPKGDEPLYTVPGSFRVAGDRLEIEAGEAPALSYGLGDCRFCTGDDPDCARDGVFTLRLHGLQEPMVAAICHPAAGGQRLSIFAPERDAAAAVKTVAGAHALRIALWPEGLEIVRDAGGPALSELWRPAVDTDADEMAWVRRLIDDGRGLRVDPPAPVTDPALKALAARLAEIAQARDRAALEAMAAPDILVSFGGNGGVEELRMEMDWPGFWDEFEAVLAGGAALQPAEGGGRWAAFPALFVTWPDDLDPFDYALGARRGAVLRVGPAASAPVLGDVSGRVLARAAYVEGDGDVYEAGWSQVCLAGLGCGFLPMAGIESPIGRRAVFSQARPGAPWVLESYVAGD